MLQLGKLFIMISDYPLKFEDSVFSAGCAPIS